MKIVRVEIPTKSPDNTLLLARRIYQKHTAMGAGSPLTGIVDMTVFNTKLTQAEGLREQGTTAFQLRQQRFNEAEKKAGLAEGQTADTEDTVYWYVQKVRNSLKNKFKGTEETLSPFGFDVVITHTGARKNVSIELPINSPEGIVSLAEEIVQEHTNQGVSSPINGLVNMTNMGTVTTDARALLNDWFTAKAEAQTYNNQALQIIGYGEGQTSFTAGTLYFMILQVRDQLLDVYQGTEETLSGFGFDVVISHSKKAKKLQPLEVSVTLSMNGIGNFDLSTVSDLYNKVKLKAIGSNGRFFASSSPTGFPGPGSFLDVVVGTPQEMSKSDLITLLSLNTLTPYLNVQNNGVGQGLYKITFSK